MNTIGCEPFYSPLLYDPDVPNPNTLIVSVNENAPYSHHSPFGSQCFCGVSVTILNDIATRLGLGFQVLTVLRSQLLMSWGSLVNKPSTITEELHTMLMLLPDRHPIEYNTSHGGAPVDLEEGRVDISVCPLSMLASSMARYDMIPLYFLRTYHISIHKRHLKNNNGVSVIKGISGSFDHNAWIGILGVSLCTLCALWLVNAATYTYARSQCSSARKWRSVSWKTSIQTYWEVICVSLGQGEIDHRNITPPRSIFLLTWLPWVLIISTIVTTSLTATLSVTAVELPFASVSSFLSSDFHFVSQASQLKELEKRGVEFHQKVVILETNNSDAPLRNMAADTRIPDKLAVMCKFGDSLSCSDKGLIPAFDSGLTNWISALQMEKNSSLTKNFTMRTQTLLQAGVIQHLFAIHRILSSENKAATYSSPRSPNKPQFENEGSAQALEWHRVAVVFYVACDLLALSVVMFVLELLTKSRLAAYIW